MATAFDESSAFRIARSAAALPSTSAMRLPSAPAQPEPMPSWPMPVRTVVVKLAFVARW